jgi:hypothetical protein
VQHQEALKQSSRLQLVVAGRLIVVVVGHATGTASVKLGGDGVGDIAQLLLLLVEVLGNGGGSVLLKPVLGLLDSLEKSLLVILVDLAAETVVVVELVLERVGVVLKTVARLNALTGSLVLLGVLLGLLNHALNFFSTETALVVGNGDGLHLSAALVTSADLEDTVGIELEGNFNLGLAARRRRNSGKLEFAEVVL